ncbi:hypothetical protein [Rathayibacter sp. VKM Ac-2760]|uniref:hypothetical protein n=1 Tax=Rathayibacter sp. VKM Ac-2760 TaxID=2609253 RepID=UPI001318809E|nr:hypothetical protein [Rathayibacter sp. VKM Ac-2760]QHC60380.1 hypothetical protein GSU72_18845 [Rathayibacter sp. VKM Ac-2760]
MDGATELPARGWEIDLNEPSRLLPSETAAALSRASEQAALLRSPSSDSGAGERAVVAARSAVRLGATEHELAVATGFTIEAVRSLLRGA